MRQVAFIAETARAVWGRADWLKPERSLSSIDPALTRRLDTIGFAVLAAAGLALGVGYAAYDVQPIDATYYWNAGHSASYYGQTWGVNAYSFYVYPPPLAQVVGLIPWKIFIVSWTTLLFVGFWAATRWWSLPVFAVSAGAIALFGFTTPLGNPIVLSGIGNPQVLVAAAVVIGFRSPVAWVFPILTKMAPVIGLLWFAMRKEWRSLGVALAATLAIAAGSFLLAPGTWFDFVRFALTNSGTTSPEPVVPVPFIVRASMSVLLIAWGARTDRRWTLPIAVGWSAIALYDWSYISVWIGALPLVRRHAVSGARIPTFGEAGSTPTGAGRP